MKFKKWNTLFKGPSFMLPENCTKVFILTNENDTIDDYRIAMYENKEFFSFEDQRTFSTNEVFKWADFREFMLEVLYN